MSKISKNGVYTEYTCFDYMLRRYPTTSISGNNVPQ